MVIFKDFLMWKLDENIGKMGRLFLDGSLATCHHFICTIID